ncbi:Methionine biosynthesis protein MetW [Clostridium sp. C105KSO15]|nr:Methionine biosynthesis protein MetW [Clostridium sp. C105KSO15]
MDIDRKLYQIVLNEKSIFKRFIKKLFLRVFTPFLGEVEKVNNQRLNSITEEYRKRLEILEENIRNNNVSLAKIEEYIARKEGKDSNIYASIDYFDFENYFRGSRELIKERQKQYIPYYANKKNVVDLGCGRGEFLELLNENRIDAIGIDAYSEAVDFCRSINLNVVQDDAIEYLKKQDWVDGIFAGQLIEHMTHDKIIELCSVAYSKLQTGSYLILETPNPMSLSIFSHAFYIDPSHEKPVHPYTVKYYLEKSGFKEIELVYPESSRLPVNIPGLNEELDDNIKEFNQSMEIVSEQLFSSQDYAIIAKK